MPFWSRAPSPGGSYRRVGQGDTVTAGQRVRLIRFGSRVDIYLPPSASVLAGEGQRTIAGESVIADFWTPKSPGAFSAGFSGLVCVSFQNEKRVKQKRKVAGSLRPQAGVRDNRSKSPGT